MTEKGNSYFLINGIGKTREEAAINFVEEMIKQFPKEKGKYNFTIRYPLSEMQDNDIAVTGEHYSFRLRGSYELTDGADHAI